MVACTFAPVVLVLRSMRKEKPLNTQAVSSGQLYEDDAATEEDLRDIACARAEYERGEATSHEDIDWS